MLVVHLNMTDFVFSSRQKSLYSEFGYRYIKFLKAPSPLAVFSQYGPSLPDGILHFMNLGAPIVHCIRLETWFYVNSKFKYNRFCFILFTIRVFILNLDLASSNF